MAIFFSCTSSTTSTTFTTSTTPSTLTTNNNNDNDNDNDNNNNNNSSRFHSKNFIPKGDAVLFWFLLQWCLVALSSSSGAKKVTRTFLFKPRTFESPQLILISGCTGTGKSTFGMSLALNLNILKCVSTDTVREVMRTFDKSPAMMRSSYEGEDDPVVNWKECCEVLQGSIDALARDAMKRGVSLVIEGVHVIPSNRLIDEWKAGGGRALGVLLAITDADEHRDLIFRRGEITKKGEEKKINAFARIRTIQDEMIRLAEESEWIRIEQQIQKDPLQIVADKLEKQAKVVGGR